MSKKRLLWLGYGDIAKRCFPILAKQQFEVSAVCRSDKVAVPSVSLIKGDLSHFDFVRDLLEIQPEYIVLTLTPVNRSAEGYRESYLRITHNLIDACLASNVSPKKVLFVSSTSVYHQQDGSCVDESSVTKPTRETAKILLESEKVLRNSNLDVLCLRFSGIYGQGRTRLIQQVLSGIGGGEQWTNRIHSEDCAHIIAFLIEQAQAGVSLPETILASDDTPVPSRELRDWIAQSLGLGKGHLRHSEELSSHKNKRCANSLLSSMGYRFIYPSYREGFQAQLESTCLHLKALQEQTQ